LLCLSYMKRRSFFNLLVAVASVILILGLSGFAWLWSHSPLALLNGSGHPNPSAIIFVPKQAPLMASLQVEPDRLLDLGTTLAKPGNRRASHAALVEFRDGLLGPDLNYDRDVKPWLGEEVTAAITSSDFDRDPTNGQTGGYLLALTTRDSTAARAFLQRFWQARSTPEAFTFEQYKGTQIIYGAVDSAKIPGLTLASGVVGDRFLLFANSPKVLRDAINNVQVVDLNLGNSPDYQKAIAALPNNRLGVVYSNLPALAALTGDGGAIDRISTEALQGLALGLGVNHQGLVAHSVLLDASPAQTASVQNAELLRYIPQNASLALWGQNLNQFWSDLNSKTKGYALSDSLLPRLLKGWEKLWDLKVPENIFSWSEGDYAVALVPGKTQTDWIFAATNNPEGTAKLVHLNEIAEENHLTVTQQKLGDRAVSLWQQPNKAIAGASTIDGDAVVIASSLETLKLGLNAGSRMSQTPGFSQISMEPANNGVLYIDWQKAKPWLDQQFPLLRGLEFVAQPIFSNLKGISVSSYGGAEGIQRGDIELAID
jgi:hypothetical protein